MPVFDEYRISETNRESGVFICKGCGQIIPLSKGETFPPCRTCASKGKGVTWMEVAIAGVAGKTYEVGANSPVSGLFLCTDCNHQIIPIAKQDNFPPCKKSGKATKWQLIVSA
jgi:hypothetical protein